jgi:hypothetical protein
MDPRVLQQGTTPADVDAQVDFQLAVIQLLSDARQFEHEVAEAHEQLEERSDELSPEEGSRLLTVADVLDQVKTADIIYPKPMLTNQISYLYDMVKNADQAPGQDAEARFAELSATLTALKAKFRSGAE